MGGIKLISNDIQWRYTFQCNQALKEVKSFQMRKPKEEDKITVLESELMADNKSFLIFVPF